MSSTKRNLLERLAEGVVVGDGSFMITLERRGYTSAGQWTPEAVILYPDAVRQLHREFLRAGSDVMQTFTFYSTDDKLQYTGIAEEGYNKLREFTSTEVNSAACDLAREVADEGGALVAGCLSPVPGYSEGKGKQFVQEECRKQCQVFDKKGVDFLLGEFFGYVEEAEWAIETMKESNKPVACTMRIGPMGDYKGVSPQDCAVRMARAGADVIGINCRFDPSLCLETIAMMKAGLESAGFADNSPYLMVQPVAYHTQDVAQNPHGLAAVPENPFALETRLISRMDIRKFARKAYDLGVRYIGGCCGFEPYHVRAIAEELAKERGKRPPGADMDRGPEGLKLSVSKHHNKRSEKEYWNNLVPAAGRENVKKLADIPQ